MARTTIPAELVAINAIQGTLIADNAITAVHIATNAVSGTLVADNAITSTHIAQNNVTATQIAQNTITVTQLADSAVETAKINNDAVTQAKIADDAVGPDQLAANAVVSASIANGTIVEADMADNAVTLAKMASLARGSIIYGDSAGDPAALSIGSNGTVLKSDGTDVSWGTISTGAALDDITTGDAASTLATSSGDITLDTPGDIILDADGGQVIFKDGGSSIGEIQQVANDLTIYSTASSHNGLRFHADGILPTDNTGAIVNNDANLGDASYRFKDLYLSNDIYINDDGVIKLGNTNGDFEIYHIGGSVNVVRGTGAMVLQSDDYISLGTHSGGELMLKATKNGAVDLYYDNVVKLSTTSAGATLQGTCLIDGLSNYTGLTVKGSGASRPMIQWSNANQGALGAIYGTEGNALVLCSGSSNTNAITLNSSQYVLIRTTSAVYDGGQLQLTSANDMYSMYVSNTGFASHGTMIAVERGGTSSYSFAQYYSGRRPDNGGGDREFNFKGDGNAYADASWNASGADYAEYFEWADGNTDNNDRVGHSVSLVNNKIKIAESGETVIGIISGNPSVVGDTASEKWTNKYLKDDYERYIWEEYTEEDGKTVDDKGNKLTRRKLNPDYNSETAYINRENRKEWDAVGLMGKLRMKKGQQTGTNWIKMRDISASVEEWLVR